MVPTALCLQLGATWARRWRCRHGSWRSQLRVWRHQRCPVSAPAQGHRLVHDRTDWGTVWRATSAHCACVPTQTSCVNSRRPRCFPASSTLRAERLLDWAFSAAQLGTQKHWLISVREPSSTHADLRRSLHRSTVSLPTERCHQRRVSPAQSQSPRLCVVVTTMTAAILHLHRWAHKDSPSSPLFVFLHAMKLSHEPSWSSSRRRFCTHGLSPRSQLWVRPRTVGENPPLVFWF